MTVQLGVVFLRAYSRDGHYCGTRKQLHFNVQAFPGLAT